MDRAVAGWGFSSSAGHLLGGEVEGGEDCVEFLHAAWKGIPRGIKAFSLLALELVFKTSPSIHIGDCSAWNESFKVSEEKEGPFNHASYLKAQSQRKEQWEHMKVRGETEKAPSSTYAEDCTKALQLLVGKRLHKS